MARSAPAQLNLTETGGAELLDGAGRTLWASDSDEDFRDEFPDFLQEEDVPELVDYLIDAGELTEDEAEQVEIGEWSQTDDDDEDAAAIADDDGDEY